MLVGKLEMTNAWQFQSEYKILVIRVISYETLYHMNLLTSYIIQVHTPLNEFIWIAVNSNNEILKNNQAVEYVYTSPWLYLES